LCGVANAEKIMRVSNILIAQTGNTTRYRRYGYTDPLNRWLSVYVKVKVNKTLRLMFLHLYCSYYNCEIIEAVAFGTWDPSFGGFMKFQNS
jgi:hypothetical protein